VHGLLHLLGYDDKTEKGRREIIGLGEEFIKIFNF
jgi:ssRNA-specific RNase YbeY (16S rRNA maturation enzyme)